MRGGSNAAELRPAQVEHWGHSLGNLLLLISVRVVWFAIAVAYMGYLVHKKSTTTEDHQRALGTGLL